MEEFIKLYTTIVCLLDHLSKLYHDCHLFVQENGSQRSCKCEIRQAHILMALCDKDDLSKAVEISKSLDSVEIGKMLDSRPPIIHDTSFKFLSSGLQVTVLQLKDVSEHFFRYLPQLTKIVHGLDDLAFEIEWLEFTSEVPLQIQFLTHFTFDLMSYLQIPTPSFTSHNLLVGQAFVMECSPKSKNVLISFNSEAKMSHLMAKKLEYILESLKYSHGAGLRLLKH